jgi:exonuclease SbcD
LGRLFYGEYLTEDQAHVLDQLITLIEETRVDAVLVSGDIYDRAVPPPEAVELLDDVLARIIVGLRVPVILIAGNHDSPRRLGFGSRLLAQRGLHIQSSVSADVTPVVIEDDAGPVYIYAVPYAEPPVVRQALAVDDAQDHDTAMRALLECVRRAHPPGRRSVLMAHAFVAGGEASESERPLSVGGAGTVSAACFEGFDYVALGHLHRPQSVGRDVINYSGSLLKYSASEATHTKSVGLVEMDGDGNCTVERTALTPRRDVRRIEAFLADVLKGPAAGESREDYVIVTLLDKGPVFEAMGQVREVYPNALHVQHADLPDGGEMPSARADHRQLDEVELFAQFFSQVTGDDLSEDQRSAFTSILGEMGRREREVAA